MAWRGVGRRGAHRLPQSTVNASAVESSGGEARHLRGTQHDSQYMLRVLRVLRVRETRRRPVCGAASERSAQCCPFVPLSCPELQFSPLTSLLASYLLPTSPCPCPCASSHCTSSCACVPTADGHNAPHVNKVWPSGGCPSRGGPLHIAVAVSRCV